MSNESVTTPWLTVEQAAQRLQLSSGYVRKLIHDGILKVIVIGPGSQRIDRADLDQMMQRRKKILAPYRTGTHPWVAARFAKGKKRAAR